MQRSTDRIPTTFVGSLIRPPEVLSLDNETDEARKTDVLQSAVDDVVRKQAEIGIDYVSDGEFGKSSWFSYVMERWTYRPTRRRDPDPLLRSHAGGGCGLSQVGRAASRSHQPLTTRDSG